MFHSEINVERKLLKKEPAWYLFKFTVKSYPDVYQSFIFGNLPIKRILVKY